MKKLRLENGGELNSKKKSRALYKKWHIKATHNVYISQHNDVIEKENQNLDGVLFKMLHSQFWKEKKNWVKVLANTIQDL